MSKNIKKHSTAYFFSLVAKAFRCEVTEVALPFFWLLPQVAKI